MEHGGVLINSSCSLLGAEDSRSRFGCIGSGAPRGATPLAGDELFSNSLGGSVGVSLFALFPSGQSRDGHPNAINTDSRDCTSLLNTSNSRSDSNSEVQILPPTAGQVQSNEQNNDPNQEHGIAERSLLPNDASSTPAAEKTKLTAGLPVRKKPSERIAANNEARDGGKDTGKETGKASRNSPDNERRLQGTWSADENVSFFNALRAHGRSFDKIHEEMGATKTREQVRCYYYRVIKKINQIIAFTGTKIDKGSNSEGNGVIDAILTWWDLMKKGNTEDTSVNLFRNSANLSDDERVAFAKRLWSKAPAKSHAKDAKSAKADKEDRKAASSVVQRIEFDGPAERPPQRKDDAAASHGKCAGKVEPRSAEPRSLPPVERTPKREVAGKARAGAATHASPTAPKLLGETPLRDERVLIQSPRGPSLSDASLDASPNAHSPLAQAEGELGGDVSGKLKLRLVARDPELGSLIKRCGCNPMLELTFKPTKAIGSIAARLSDKWGAKLAELLEQSGRKLGGGGAVQFRLHMPRENDSHQGWGADDKTVQACDVHSFMGSPARFSLWYSLQEPSDATPPSAAPPLKQGELASSLEPDSSSSSNDFVPFQRHLARLDDFQHGGGKGDGRGSSADFADSNSSSNSRMNTGSIDFGAVAKGAGQKMPPDGGPWTEEEVLFSSMLASRDGMGYTHSNMERLTYPGDSLDGLNALLNPDESSLGAALGAGSSSKPAPEPPAPTASAPTAAGAPAGTPAPPPAAPTNPEGGRALGKPENADASPTRTGAKRPAETAAAEEGPPAKTAKQE